MNHFNTYNKIERVVEKSGLVVEDYSIVNDCQLTGPMFNTQKLYMNANTHTNNPLTSS